MTVDVAYQKGWQVYLCTRIKKAMILHRLSVLEAEIKQIVDQDLRSLDAVKNLHSIFSQVNFDEEMVVTDDYERLCKLAESLKGEILTEKERELLAGIMD